MKTTPLPNVHLGVSAENQDRADERIPILMETPAAVRFVSLEPLLGPVDLGNLREGTFDAITGCGDRERLGVWEPSASLDWVIVGGESGPGARPCDVDWIDSVVAQCAAAGTPCFVKQLGSVTAREMGMKHRAGADPSEWPTTFWPQEFPR